jgi:hypothetical protein
VVENLYGSMVSLVPFRNFKAHLSTAPLGSWCLSEMEGSIEQAQKIALNATKVPDDNFMSLVECVITVPLKASQCPTAESGKDVNEHPV